MQTFGGTLSGFLCDVTVHMCHSTRYHHVHIYWYQLPVWGTITCISYRYQTPSFLTHVVHQRVNRVFDALP